MMESSCIYIGEVIHHRLRPRAHRLRYRVFWLFLDLEDIDSLSEKLRFFSRNRFNLVGFFDRDHGDGGGVPLRKQAETVLRRAGLDPGQVGAIKLLCMPRILGYAFNPLSVYFCCRRDGALEAIIYEVHNTLGERHNYVIAGRGAKSEIEQHCDKEFYVSPFLGMDMSYTFHVSLPKERVSIVIHGKEGGESVIAASLSGRRRRLSEVALLKAFITHPLMTLKVVTAIHWHALRLVLKGFRIHPHEPPARRSKPVRL